MSKDFNPHSFKPYHNLGGCLVINQMIHITYKPGYDKYQESQVHPLKCKPQKVDILSEHIRLLKICALLLSGFTAYALIYVEGCNK